MKTKLFSLFLVLVASTGMMFAESGKCGDNLTWNLTNDVLTISGTGAMYDFEYDGNTDATTSPWYSLRNGITAVVINAGVMSIGNYAFCRCTGFTSIVIPNSVTNIGEYAFFDCASLASITIGNSVTNIGAYAFAYCTGLTSIEIPNSVTSIGESAFRGCTGLTSIEIPNSVTSIGRSAFYECTGLTSVTIPNSLTDIGMYAFAGCTGLTSITIPNSVTSIEEAAFSGCTGLTSITIPNSVTSIEEGAFSGCTGLTSITIPNSVTSIEEGAFRDVTNIVYSGGATGSPWGAKSINGYVDGYLVFNDESKTILTGCSSIPTKVIIPNSVTSIGNRAFSSCRSLSSVTIPNSVTSIGDYAFYYCSSLTSVIIPNSVTSIGSYAFCQCFSLTSITIPNSVTSIGEGAFYACTVLTSVIIPNSVTSIEKYAFGDCSRLTSIIIPNNVTSIGERAFLGCTSLTSVTIPNSVTSIGAVAFSQCVGLTSVTCYATTPPELGIYVFRHVYCSQVTLYVPVESIEAYKAAEQWKDFGSILPISAKETETTDITTTTTTQSVDITWPFVAGAETYELVIKDKEGNIVCTLIFNAQGQLISIAYNAPSRGGAPQHTQTAGFSFTITGLEAGTSYELTITAKDANGQELDKKDVTFHTESPEGIEDIHIDSDKPVKVLHNGQVFILHGDKTYTISGNEL